MKELTACYFILGWNQSWLPGMYSMVISYVMFDGKNNFQNRKNIDFA